MIRAAATTLLLLSGVAHAADVERPGAPAVLCREVARVVRPALAGGAVRLQLTAEGGALDLVPGVRAACAAELAQDPAGSDLRVRLRVGDGRLLALVELAGRGVAPLSTTVEAPLDETARRWLAAGGSGLETVLAGRVEVDALALCGRAAEDGVSLFFVSKDGVHRARWSDGVLAPSELLAPLPPSLVPRARVPAAQAECLPDGGVRVGIPDRNREVTLVKVDGRWSWVDEREGLSIGDVRTAGRPGTPLVEWKGRLFGALASRTGAPLTLSTQDGRLLLAPTPETVPAETRGAWSRTGSALAWMLVPSLSKAPVLVTSRALLPGDSGEDGLVVLRASTTPEMLVETPRIGSVRALSVLRIGAWERALALVPADGRADLYAFGSRHPPP